jgi:hypothetical protein
MNKKWRAAIIATAALLLVGTLAFAEATGSSRQTGEQKAPFTLGEQANCGGPGGSFGGCGGFGGGGYDDGNGNGGNYGNGGGFSCH